MRPRALRCGSGSMSATNALSIFSTSTGRWRRCERLEKPVPKSSIAMRTPRAQLREHQARALDVAHHAGLGDLELQPTGLAAGPGEDALEVGDHRRVAQLARGEVHANHDVAHAAVAPRARL